MTSDQDDWGGYIPQPDEEAASEGTVEQPAAALPPPQQPPPASAEQPPQASAGHSRAAPPASALTTRVEGDLQIPVSLKEAMRVCRAAAPRVGAKIKAEGEDWIRLSRGFGLSRNPSSFELLFEETAAGTTAIRIYADQFGFGPYVKRQISRALETLTAAIAAEAR